MPTKPLILAMHTIKLSRIMNPPGRLTEKTSKLCHQFLLIYAKKGDLVLDMQAGSGSMAVACMQHGCRYLGTEIAEEVHKATQLKLA